ncbi:MAG TPA: hypothetical protein VNO30_47870 [Kofleriaceae bacterium]|nr:hypothetical protein [Kofleriaceae bacterium]
MRRARIGAARIVGARIVGAALGALAALGACDGASPDPGLGLWLQVQGAQHRPGPFPADEGGPAAIDVQTRHGQILIDRINEPLDATLDPAAHAAVIGIAGSPGTWLVRAGAPDSDTPGLPSAKAVFGVADGFPPGPFTLVVAASDADGRFGAPATTEIVALHEVPPAEPLAIGLLWDGAADLDIHVVDPLGGEAWSDDPNTYVPPPPGEPIDPEEYKRHGILDRDANQSCRRDGRPAEYVIWRLLPPPGEYVVRVDARAMCGDAIAHWSVVAYRMGELIGAARGASTEGDVLLPHGAGAGVLALRFAL